ncbi:MAG: transglutaminase domain-containing protein [Lachnospiraceae bacterium]|nr:transglutaminase domain-containing protein [Lachnospiraceae bacterium]
MFFFKTKKNTISDETLYGFSFPAEPASFTPNMAVLCTVKAMLVFCATWGTIGGLLSAFSIRYNSALVMTALLLISFILAFLHYNAVIFNMVYPVLFVIFTYAIIQCRIIANSGFQSFISVLFEEYSSYFNLSLSREVTISFGDQYLAITVASIFVGFFLALLLNIAISTYMSLLLTLMLTFPLLQLAIYIEKYPDIPFLCFILSSYVIVGILGRSRHYDLPLKKKKRTFFHVTKKKKKKSSYTLHNYKASGTILLETASRLVILSALFMIASYSLLINHDAQQTVSNSLKAKTDEYLKIFVQSGLSGFFDRYSATGGISGGKLGGVSSVRPDYQPDLKVTFAPYSYDTIYLKAFTGADYTGNEWLPPSHSEDSVKKIFGSGYGYTKFLKYSAGIEGKRLAYLFEHSGNNLKGKMKIENLDADADYLYLPYYIDYIFGQYHTEQSIFSGSLPIGSTLEVSYYPPVNAGLLTGSFSETEIPELSSSFPLNATQIEESYYEIYNMNNQIYYKSIPPSLEPVLNEIRDEIGKVELLEDQILLIQDYLSQNYSYSMSPGTTPVNEDFVNYFLTHQKQGYCVHFASAATMLFRSYGYPARYVEGYVITFQDMANAQAIDEPYEDYLQGDAPLGRTGVIEANITDGNAHAWVEVYKEGFGWIPVEVTPPSSEGDNTYSDFWDVFSGLFSVSGTQNITAGNAAGETELSRWDAFLSSTDLITGPIFLLAGCMLLIPILLWLFRKLFIILKMLAAFQKGSYVPMLSYYYQKLVRKLKKKKLLKESDPTPEQLKKLLLSLLLETNGDAASSLEEYTALLEKGCYSKEGLSKEQALTFRTMTRQFIKRID